MQHDAAARHSPASRLDSWKAIADYLHRDVSTVRRWEKQEGLPVHRHRHHKLGSVYAFRAEIDAWWATRSGPPATAAALQTAGGPADPPADSPDRAGTRAPAWDGWRRVAILGACCLPAALALWSLVPVQEPPAPADCIAVMPIVDATGIDGSEEIADRLTEAIIGGLSAVPDLKVISRTSSFRYKRAEIVPRRIGRELGGVEALVTGRMRVQGSRVELALELIDTRDDRQLWTHTYLREPVGLAAAVADDLARVLTGRQAAAATRYRRGDAYDLYLRGRHHWYKRTPEGFDRAIAAFTQAIERDPAFAPAYAGLADTYTLMGYFSYLIPFEEARSKARAAALTALALDDGLAEAHTSMASVLEFERWDWVGAEREYRRAIDLAPNYVTARHWYANNLSVRGRHDEAIAQATRAVELDPLAPILRVALAHAYLLAGREDEAIRHLEVALEIEPASATARLFLGMAYARQARYEEARAEMVRANDQLENWVWKAFLADLYTRMNRQVDARRIVDGFHARRPPVSRVTAAAIYAAVGERSRALDLLRRACDARDPDIGFIQSVPAFDRLRSEPAFAALLRRAGLG